jgi:hypothetical protein
MARVEQTRTVRVALWVLRVYLVAMLILLGLRAFQLFG